MSGYCIIIDSKLMASRLPRCLATLSSAAEQHAGRVEIRVVTDADNARLATLSRRFGARLEVIRQATIGARCNAVARATQSTILVFPSPCGRLNPDCLTRADQLLKRHAWDVVIFQPQDVSLLRSLSELWRRPRDTGTLCVDRHWFERIGGFDASLGEAAFPDLVSRLRACHARVLELPL